MHDTAYDFVRRMVAMLPKRMQVAELGSFNVNGTPRPLFPGAEYVGIDLRAGPGVDIVADAATWEGIDSYDFDTVVCMEVLEHTLQQKEIITNVLSLLCDGGVFLMTAATDPRPAHSVNGHASLGDEPYKNVDVAALREWLYPFHFSLIDTSVPCDVYALAVK